AERPELGIGQLAGQGGARCGGRGKPPADEDGDGQPGQRNSATDHRDILTSVRTGWPQPRVSCIIELTELMRPLPPLPPWVERIKVLCSSSGIVATLAQKLFQR